MRQSVNDVKELEKRRKQFSKVDKKTGLLFIAQQYPDDEFHRCKEWKQLAFRVYQHKKAKCEQCGEWSMASNPVQIHHILSRWTHPELAFDTSNLQMLCNRCVLFSKKGIKNNDKGKSYILRKKVC